MSSSAKKQQKANARLSTVVDTVAKLSPEQRKAAFKALSGGKARSVSVSRPGSRASSARSRASSAGSRAKPRSQPRLSATYQPPAARRAANGLDAFSVNAARHIESLLPPAADASELYRSQAVYNTAFTRDFYNIGRAPYPNSTMRMPQPHIVVPTFASTTIEIPSGQGGYIFFDPSWVDATSAAAGLTAPVLFGFAVGTIGTAFSDANLVPAGQCFPIQQPASLEAVTGAPRLTTTVDIGGTLHTTQVYLPLNGRMDVEIVQATNVERPPLMQAGGLAQLGARLNGFSVPNAATLLSGTSVYPGQFTDASSWNAALTNTLQIPLGYGSAAADNAIGGAYTSVSPKVVANAGTVFLQPFCDNTGAFHYRSGCIQTATNLGSPNVFSYGQWSLGQALGFGNPGTQSLTSVMSRVAPYIYVENNGGGGMQVVVRAQANIAVLPRTIEDEYLRSLLRVDVQGPLLASNIIETMSVSAVSATSWDATQSVRTAIQKALLRHSENPRATPHGTAGAIAALGELPPDPRRMANRNLLAPVPVAEAAQRAASTAALAHSIGAIAQTPAAIATRPTPDHVIHPGVVESLLKGGVTVAKNLGVPAPITDLASKVVKNTLDVIKNPAGMGSFLLNLGGDVSKALPEILSLF